MNLSLLAAILSLLVLLAEPIFTKWNRWRYEKKEDEISKDKFEAAMKRKKHFKTIALFALVVSVILSTWSNQEGSKMSEDKFNKIQQSLEGVHESVSKIGGRITKIEKYIWGGGADGNVAESPSSPDGNPGSSPEYLTIDERFSRIENTISRVQQNAVTQQEVEEIRREIIELRVAIKQYEKIMDSIGVPAR
ncbi:MAG: hypothetical protein AB2665_03375 [Candidatus Thiodiazotropha sp.]